MPIKIYTKGNYIYGESTETGQIAGYHRKDITITEHSVGANVFDIYWHDRDIFTSLRLEDIVKENGQPYNRQQFMSFIETQTG